MTPELLGRAVSAAHLSGMMPDLRAVVDKMKEQVVNRAFLAVKTGKIEPEVAIQAWIELYTLDEMLKKLEKAVKIDLQAAETVKSQLQIGE